MVLQEVRRGCLCPGGRRLSSTRDGSGSRHQSRTLPKKSQLIQPPQARVSCLHPLPAVSLMIYLMRHLGGLSHTETL